MSNLDLPRIRLGIAGANGRMGRAVADVVAQFPALVLTGQFGRPGTPAEGTPERDMILAACDVVIDFTSAEGAIDLAKHCAAQRGPALVIGSTGLSPDQHQELARLALHLPLLHSGNFSLGLNLLLQLAAKAAQLLPPEDWDIEIAEAHHRRKLDAPSGTALMLGDAVADARGTTLAAVAVRSRDGLTGPRAPGEIGFAVQRGGGLVGEHSVAFLADDEMITLSHSARNRAVFARGACHAALWLAGKPAGLYSFQDTLP